jgi:hypothetical protein
MLATKKKEEIFIEEGMNSENKNFGQYFSILTMLLSKFISAEQACFFAKKE